MPWELVEEMTFNGSNMVVLDVSDITVATYILSSLSSSLEKRTKCLAAIKAERF